MDPIMFAADPYILAFVKGNFIALAIAYVIFKGIASMTKSKTDDKIVRIIREAITTAAGDSELPDPDFSDLQDEATEKS